MCRVRAIADACLRVVFAADGKDVDLGYSSQRLLVWKRGCAATVLRFDDTPADRSGGFKYQASYNTRVTTLLQTSDRQVDTKTARLVSGLVAFTHVVCVQRKLNTTEA